MIKERMNKKAQGLSVNAIILIVLGVIILVLLIAGFTIGWSKILPFIGGGDNVGTIVQQCQIACSTSSVYDYCTKERTLTVDGENPLDKDKSCSELVSPKYGIAECPQLASQCADAKAKIAEEVAVETAETAETVEPAVE